MQHYLSRVILTLIISFLFTYSIFAQEFRIQIAAYVNQIPFTHFAFSGITDIYMKEDQNSIYRYYLGSAYATLEQAQQMQVGVKSRGFLNAQIVDMVLERERCGFPCPYITATTTFSSASVENLKVKNIFFGFDKSSLSKTSRDELDQIYKILDRDRTINAMIQGHTDSKGDASYNIKLSLRRARAARNYLIAKGIAARRLKAKVFGESAPLVTNQSIEGKDNPLGRKYNRRVVIALFNPKGEIIK